MRLLTLAAVVVVVVVAVAAPAAQAATWLTPGQALANAKRQGVRFSDGTTRPVGGFCNGSGARRGDARPVYRTFRCTLVFRSGAGTAWYDVQMTAGLRIARVYSVN